MTPKVIKTEADHEATLARIEQIFDAALGTPAGDELELLTMLVHQYEEKAFPIGLPDPVAAIRFRMEQQELKARDLIPFIGSAPKVSEVLNGQRNLSLTMIRKLVKGLGIPAEVLLKEQGAQLPNHPLGAETKKLPLNEMLKRGWFAGFTGTLSEAKDQIEDLLLRLAAPLGAGALQPAFNRQQQHLRNGSQADPLALAAWQLRVASIAAKENLPPYRHGTITRDFAQELVRLSYFDEGPKLAKEFLNKNGIHAIVEPHLPKTFLDGAALKLPDGSPVVGLTLRHDRLDNFWFTLCHELAHVALHLDTKGFAVFFDDITKSSKDQCEKQADEFAKEALIPGKLWNKSGLTKSRSSTKVREFAEALRISPAIPAGRIRFETNNYTVFKELVGTKVRPLLSAA